MMASLETGHWQWPQLARGAACLHQERGVAECADGPACSQPQHGSTSARGNMTPGAPQMCLDLKEGIVFAKFLKKKPFFKDFFYIQSADVCKSMSHGTAASISEST